MSIYTYPQSKVISQVTFHKTGNGAIRAYLHACPEADTATTCDVLKTLRDANLNYVPYTLDGKPTLEVRGFSRGDKLLALLDQQKCIEGPAQKTLQPDDHITWMDKFRNRTLQASGVSMGIADIGFTVYGLKERNVKDMIAGLAYLSGSSVLTAYGRNDQSNLQIREIAEMILNHAKEKGYDIPEQSAVSATGGKHEESPIRKVDNFFRKHPSEIGNMMYFTAGSMIAWSALKNKALAKPRPDMTAQQIHKMRMGGWGDTALGATTMAAGLFATLVKEKAHDPDQPKAQGLAGIKEWVQEHPLAITGGAYIGSTLCHAFTTFVENKEARRVVKDLSISAKERAIAHEKLTAIPWRILFITATIIGEVLLSVSSKGHGEGVVNDKSVDNSLIALSADLIHKQPEHMQGQLVGEVAKFLGQSKVLAMNDTEVETLLREHVEALRDNPWARVKGAVQTAAPQPVKTASMPAKTTLQGEVPAWQAKLASESVNSKPQLSA